MVPGASQELLDLLVDILYGGGEETKLYSSIVIQRFSYLAQALGLGEMEIGASPPNSQELETHPSPASSMSPSAFCDSPQSSAHGGETEAMLHHSLSASPDPGAKELYFKLYSQTI